MKNVLQKQQVELNADQIERNKSKTTKISENEIIRQLKELGYM